MKFIKKIIFLLLIPSLIVSCDVEEFSDLNNPEVDAFTDNFTRGDLPNLIGGIFYSTRVRLGTYYDDVAVIGREYWRFSSSDPRFTSDLLGKGTAVLDNNTFYTTAPWGARYRTIKNANLILGFIDPSRDLSGQFTDQELSGTRGFLRTMIAYELLLNLNLTYDNGIRIDVADEDNLGPFVSRADALSGIRTLLETGATEIENGAFPFNMSSGFSGFDTTEKFLEFNKAISARVATYQEDYPAVLDFLSDSFLDLAGNLSVGPAYAFSEDQTDIINPLFFAKNSSSAGARIAHPSFIAQAETGDTRLNKVVFREVENGDTGVLEPNPITFDDLTGAYDFFLYDSREASIPIVRNEELVLLYAEANIFSNPAEAVTALNVVRNNANLGNYTGPVTENDLIAELLNQRRYSLYGEGHRWIDARRFDILDDLPIDRVDDDGNPDNVWDQFPIPLTENQ